MNPIIVIANNKAQLNHAVCFGAIKSQLNISPSTSKTLTKSPFYNTSKNPVLKLKIVGRPEEKQLNVLTDSFHQFNDHLAVLHPILLKVAKTRLRNNAWAEDAVSETIIAALEKPNAFAGRSMMCTWLIGILKNKVVDQIRKHTRECQIMQFDEESDADFDNSSQNINEEHAGWGNPENSAIQQQFITKLDQCLKKLPKQQAQVFKLRYGMEMEPGEICHQLGLTNSNLHVMLHRSRALVRGSLV